MYPLCSRISLCSFCVAKNLHYRVATCVKNIQNTERVKHDLRNIFAIFFVKNLQIVLGFICFDGNVFVEKRGEYEICNW